MPRRQIKVDATIEDLYTDPLNLIAIAGTIDDGFITSVTNRLVLFAAMSYGHKGQNTMVSGRDILTRFNLRPGLLDVAKTLSITRDERQALIARCLESIRSCSFILRPYKVSRNNGPVREYAIRIDRGSVEDRDWVIGC